jgi:hypothetical protein
MVSDYWVLQTPGNHYHLYGENYGFSPYKGDVLMRIFLLNIGAYMTFYSDNDY